MRTISYSDILELRYLKRLLIFIESGLEDIKAQKFRADQPRIPAGEPNGGQWTSEEITGAVKPQQLAARRISKARERECDQQYERDLIQCKIVRLPACYNQAIQRHAACMEGHPIPPFNY